jgi:hypothetical protein
MVVGTCKKTCIVCRERKRGGIICEVAWRRVVREVITIQAKGGNNNRLMKTKRQR